MYCPKCDLDFVDGITVCSDCGGRLVTHEEYEKQLQEAAEKAAEEKRREEEERRQAAENMINAAMGASAASREGASCGDLQDGNMQDGAGDGNESSENADRIYDGAEDSKDYADLASEDPQIAGGRSSILRSSREESSVYVSKASEYEDNKSSAGAFFLVGGIITAVMILVYAGVIDLPAAFNSLLTKIMLTVIGVGFLAIGVMSSRKASQLKGQAAEESKVNEDLINWFIDNYTMEQIDCQAKLAAGEGAEEEELALARLAYIQDELLTHHDIGDKAYADSLAEEIYARMFEAH